MPIEQRQLLFSETEVLAAVRDYLDRTDHRMPSGRPIHCDLEHEIDGVRFVLTIQTDLGALSQLRVEERELAAAMIMYCRLHGIPLPRKAEKTLVIANGSLLLQFTSPASRFVRVSKTAERV